MLYQVRPEGRLGVPTFFGMKPSEIACVSFVGTKLSQDCQPSRQANSGTHSDCTPCCRDHSMSTQSELDPYSLACEHERP